jgi:hypothetical protein
MFVHLFIQNREQRNIDYGTRETGMNRNKGAAYIKMSQWQTLITGKNRWQT